MRKAVLLLLFILATASNGFSDTIWRGTITLTILQTYCSDPDCGPGGSIPGISIGDVFTGFYEYKSRTVDALVGHDVNTILPDDDPYSLVIPFTAGGIPLPGPFCDLAPVCFVDFPTTVFGVEPGLKVVGGIATDFEWSYDVGPTSINLYTHTFGMGCSGGCLPTGGSMAIAGSLELGNPTRVPEPASLSLLAIGLAALKLRTWKRSGSKQVGLLPRRTPKVVTVGICSFALLWCLAPVAQATPIVNFVGGNDFTITSITGLDIGGVLYDATFHNKQAGFYTLVNPITFQSFADASVAIAAITDSVLALGIQNIPLSSVIGFTDHAVVPYATDGVFVQYALNFLVGCCNSTFVYNPLIVHPTLGVGPAFDSGTLNTSCSPLCPGYPVDLDEAPGGGQWVTFQRSKVPEPSSLLLLSIGIAVLVKTKNR